MSIMRRGRQRRSRRPRDRVQWPHVEFYVKWDSHPKTKEEWTEERRRRNIYYKSAVYRKRMALVRKFHRHMDLADRRRRGGRRRRR